MVIPMARAMPTPTIIPSIPRQRVSMLRTG